MSSWALCHALTLQAMPCQNMSRPPKEVSFRVVHEFVSCQAKFASDVLGTNILVPGTWAEYWCHFFGTKILVQCTKNLVPSVWSPDCGTIILVAGSLYQDLGTKFLVPRPWYQVHGTRIFVPSSCQLLGTKILVPGTLY